MPDMNINSKCLWGESCPLGLNIDILLQNYKEIIMCQNKHQFFSRKFRIGNDDQWQSNQFYEKNLMTVSMNEWMLNAHYCTSLSFLPEIEQK